MPGQYPFQKQSKYPHLRPEDIAVWEKFIEKFPDAYITVDYDVRVGKGREYPETPGEKIQEDMIHLSKKRIDVIGYTPSTIDIIEVKPIAGLSAIGQVESYEMLYRMGHPEAVNIRKVIIANEIDPDTHTIVIMKNILIFLTL